MDERKLKSVVSGLLPRGLYLSLKSIYRQQYRYARRLRKTIRKINRDHPELSLRVLDIGARHGLGAFGYAELAELENLHLEGIEPDAEEAKSLEDPSSPWPYARVHPVAVAETTGARSLFLTKARGCSSLYPPIESKFRHYSKAWWFELEEEAVLHTTTLSELFPRGDRFDYVKIDVQGAELNVMRGGPDLIGDAVGITLETNFVELYRGQSLFPDVHGFLTSRGFSLIFLENAPYAFDGEIVEANCGYLKAMESVQSKEQLVKQLLFCTMCGNRSYAGLLLRHVGAKLLSPQECRRWQSVVV